ncbi:MAG: glycerophosphodiester phosphodiesterase [Hyphomicrobiales bacterium]|nr:glycerophosphodiester phosphodiesterase [Hyphomicrobiales bacterium]
MVYGGLSWLTKRPVAHRGLHDFDAGIVENTLPAFAAACNAGYAIEADLWLSADGVPVVFHDETLERLAGRPERVSDTPFEALKNVALVKGDAGISALDELLSLVSGRVPVLLELKPHADEDGITDAVISKVTGYAGPIAIMSFDPRILIRARKTAPHLPRGILGPVMRPVPNLALRHRFALNHYLHIRRTAPHFVGHEQSRLPALAPLFIRWALGMPLLTWTVKDERTARRKGFWANQIIFEGFRP